jgi:hypothetical protein
MPPANDNQCITRSAHGSPGGGRPPPLPRAGAMVENLIQENQREILYRNKEQWGSNQEARNAPLCPSHEKFDTVVLQDVRNISDTL